LVWVERREEALAARRVKMKSVRVVKERDRLRIVREQTFQKRVVRELTEKDRLREALAVLQGIAGRDAAVAAGRRYA
jgi:hypothetical protein